MTPTTDPDTDLVRRLQESADEDAFNTLYDRYAGKVYSYCLAFLGDEDDAKDCAQETFIRVFRGIGAFRLEAKFSTWIYRIMSNLCKDMAKKMRFRNRMISTEQAGWQAEGGRLAEPVSFAPDPFTELNRKEMEQLYLRALEKLNPAFRQVVILRDMEGRSYEEIAEITGKNPGTVRSALSRGRDRMAKILKTYRNAL